jgi:hypothetical protein
MPRLAKRCRSPSASQAFLYLCSYRALAGTPSTARGTAKVANVGSIIGTAARDMPSPGGFPEEHYGRRPPPFSACLCPAWFPDTSPLFSSGQRCRYERFRPIELVLGIKLVQKSPPAFAPHVRCVPVSQTLQPIPGEDDYLGRSFQHDLVRKIHKISAEQRRIGARFGSTPR